MRWIRPGGIACALLLAGLRAASAPNPPGPRFSTHTAAPTVALSTLHFAIPTAIRAHPSGDVVLAGCTQGPTDLLPTVDERRVLTFVARVDPRSGAIRWVRQLPLSEGAFQNGCGVHHDVNDHRWLYATTQFVVTGDGAILVAALVGDDGPAAPRFGAPPAGTVILSLDPADGTTRWQHPVAGRADPVMITHLLADGAGVAAIVCHASTDGLDTYSLLRLDGAGRATESPLLRTTPMPGRRRPCYTGANGCSVNVDYVSRAEDGSLAIYGRYSGVELAFGAMSIRSSSNGLGFWAVVEPDGTPRSLRGGGPVLTTIVRAHGHRVVATVYPPSDVELVDPVTGAHSSWRGADAGWPIARTLRLHEERRRHLDGAAVTDGPNTYALAPAATSPLTATSLRQLAQADPDSKAPQIARLLDGSLAAIFMLSGTLHVSGQDTSSTHRLVACDPGNVGEEFPQTPDCREPRGLPSAVLVVWPPAP